MLVRGQAGGYFLPELAEMTADNCRVSEGDGMGIRFGFSVFPIMWFTALSLPTKPRRHRGPRQLRTTEP